VESPNMTHKVLRSNSSLSCPSSAVGKDILS